MLRELATNLEGKVPRYQTDAFVLECKLKLQFQAHLISVSNMNYMHEMKYSSTFVRV